MPDGFNSLGADDWVAPRLPSLGVNDWQTPAPPPPQKPPEPQPAPETSSAAGAFARAATQQVLPTAGGMAAAGMGAATGAALGAMIPIAGETGIPEVIGGLGGGLFGFFAGAKAVEEVQQGLINRLPESMQRAIGQAPEQRQADEAQHPYASMAGGLAPSLMFLRPGAVEKAAENAPAIARVMANPIAARVFGAGVNTSLEAVQEQQQGEGYDPIKLGISAGTGALLNRETALGRRVAGAGPAAISRLMRPSVPTVETITNAPDLDTAIEAADKVASTVAPGTPIDVDQEIAQLGADGSAGALQQAQLIQLFHKTNVGTVEQDANGGYHYRATDASGTEITHPIEVYDPHTAPEPGAVTAETADALRTHYDQAGVNVVFYKDHPGIQFDGAQDPSQPDTIFLSSNPARNIAQVATHEFTHVLQATTLPDGSSLGDLLNQQIASGITPAGQRHAQRMFGSTAPKRIGFADGVEGDQAHADAVQAHLINELGTDIGGEAPRFRSFLPRVVDAIQARFGDSVAADVLGKLINGLKSAMETVRGLFAEGGTRSQHWVTNIGEIHDTLAQMYASRFGSPVEREQAALADMRDRAERDRYVATPEPRAPPEQASQPAVVSTFQTSKGSTYDVHADGTTRRDKSYHPEHGLVDQGPQPRSETTFYVTPEQAVSLGEIQTSGPRRAIVRMADGRVGVGYLEGPSAGKVESRTVLTPQTAPAPGLIPVELWNNGARVHFGNEIVGTSVPSPAPDYGAIREATVTSAEALKLRRWLDQLARERDAQASSTPQARLLTQTEAAILRPVEGDATKLPEAAQARLGEVRQKLDAVTHPQADTPEMAKVRTRIRTIRQIQDEQGVGPRAAATIQEAEIAAVGRPITAEEATARKAGVQPAGPAELAPVPPPTRSPASGLESINPADVGVDAQRFQFKAGGDESGVTDRLQGVEKWDQRLAGTVMVWRDENGRDWIADGHQRLGLAKRLQANDPNIRMNAFVLDSADGITAGQARAYAAAKNIAEGSGSAIDAAKMIREAAANADINLPPLPPRSALVRDGQALAKLGPEAFGMAVNEVVPHQQAAIVGRLVSDPAQQAEAIRLLAQYRPENVRQTESIVRELLATGTELATQDSLFGPQNFASSVVLERAKIIDEATRQLGRDRTTFATLVNRADEITGAGNQLATDTNRARLTTDERASATLQSLATTRGPISDELSAIAREFKSDAITRADAGRRFLGVVRRGIEAGVDGGADAGSTRSGDAGSAGDVAFSPRRSPVPPKEGEDLFGVTAPRPRVIAPPEPTIRDDARQADMFGKADAAVQAQAARDQAVRGGINPRGEVKPADEGLFAPDTSGQRPLFSPRREEDRTPLYSALTRAVEGIKQEKATPGQWIATLKNMAGVKPEERAWTGLDDWLGRQPKSVTKAEVLDYLRANALDVREVVKGQDKGLGRAQDAIDTAAEDRRGSYQAIDQAMMAHGHYVDLGDGDHLYSDEVARGLASGNIKSEALPEYLRGAAQAYVEAVARHNAANDHYAAAEEAGRQLRPTKFGQYQLPGGKDYREMLITLPVKPAESGDEIAQRMFGKRFRDLSGSEKAAAQNEANAADRQRTYRSAHWDEPNVVAHTRFSERTASDGAKVLHIEEIQSDWHQAGRKSGYKGEGNDLPGGFRVFQPDPANSPQAWVMRNPRGPEFDTPRFFAASEAEARQVAAQNYGSESRAVPDAPFKTTWPMLAMKRMTQFAVDHDFDRVVWTPGDVQADRYSLARHIGRIDHERAHDPDTGQPLDSYEIWAHDKTGGQILHEDEIPKARVAELVGQEMADKIQQGQGEHTGGAYRDVRSLTGLDLKAGGEGMRGFYDRQLPSEVQKLIGKFGSHVEQSEIGTGKPERDTLKPDAQATAEHSPQWQQIVDRINETTADTEEAYQLRRQLHDQLDVLHARMIDETLARSINTQSVHSFDISPKLREAVQSQGLPLFSPREQVAAREQRETERWTPEQTEAYRHVGRVVVTPTWRERLSALTDDIGRRTVRYWLDPYIGVKADDPAGYMALRNANTTAGAIEMFLTDGTLKFNGSTYAMDRRNGGVEHYLVRPLQGEQDKFIWWVAANRAERLSSEDRENLWSQEDIDTLKASNQGQVPFDYTLENGQVTRSREAIYLDSLRKLDVFNKNALDLAVQSGLLDADKVSTLFANPFYVPFYRVAEDDGRFAGPNLTSGFVKQNAFKTLTGGTQKLNNDLWDNAIKNWSHMIDASLRNKAASGVLDVGVTNGAVTELSPREVANQTKAEAKTTVWVMNNGQKQSFLVHDPLLYSAISALDFSGFRNPVMNAMTKFKTILTQGVTADPRFMLRVSIRDAEQAIATAPMSYNLVKNVTTGFKMGDLPGAIQNVARSVAGQQMQRLSLSGEAADVIAGGGTMRLGSGHDTGGRHTDLNTMLDNPTAINAFWHRVSQFARAYKEVTAQAEDTQRFALYHKLIADGVPHDQASFAARDLEDFTLKGAGGIARVLTQTVPFMNAWLQGLYKVGRAAFNQDRSLVGAVAGNLAASTSKRVGIVLGTTALLTLALDAIYADDEDYKKRTDYDRDSNFWFKFGNTQFRIPMGFEIAAMSRIAANGVEALFGQNEMTGRRFANSVLQILGTNMSMNPLPQAARPFWDIATNQSGTGAPIVTQGMDRLRSEQQYTPSTTLLARWASSGGSIAARAIAGPQAQFLAPVQIDYLVNGYFGWLGSHVVNLADMTIRGLDQAQASMRGEQPMESVRPGVDLWNFVTGGMISTATTPQSRYVDMLYQQAAGIRRAYATYHDLIARGQVEDARAFFAANKDQISKFGLIEKVTQVETTANQQIKRIGESSRLSAEQKRLEIMKYNAMRNRAAENVFGTRPVVQPSP